MIKTQVQVSKLNTRSQNNLLHGEEARAESENHRTVLADLQAAALAVL
jgi:hypothetical protein